MGSVAERAGGRGHLRHEAGGGDELGAGDERVGDATALGAWRADEERAAKLLGAKFIDPERIEQLCWAGLIGRTSFQSIYAKDLHRIAVAWEMLAAFGVEPADLLALQQEALRNAWQPKRKK